MVWFQVKLAEEGKETGGRQLVERDPEKLARHAARIAGDDGHGALLLPAVEGGGGEAGHHQEDLGQQGGRQLGIPVDKGVQHNQAQGKLSLNYGAHKDIICM